MKHVSWIQRTKEAKKKKKKKKKGRKIKGYDINLGHLLSVNMSEPIF